MTKVDLLSGLTKSQKEAVNHNKGPILVVAGAGTGKTTVITKRVAYLVQEKLAKPEEILALTFPLFNKQMWNHTQDFQGLKLFFSKRLS